MSHVHQVVLQRETQNRQGSKSYENVLTVGGTVVELTAEDQVGFNLALDSEDIVIDVPWTTGVRDTLSNETVFQVRGNRYSVQRRLRSNNSVIRLVGERLT